MKNGNDKQGADYDQRLVELSKFAKDNLKKQMAILAEKGFINTN